MLRLIINQTFFSGRPSLDINTLRLVNSYSIGPFVPSETVRLYQKKSFIVSAKAFTEIGFFSVSSKICFARSSPLYLYFFFPDYRSLKPTQSNGRNPNKICSICYFFSRLNEFRA